MTAAEDALAAFLAQVARAVAPLVPRAGALAAACDLVEVGKGAHLLAVGEVAGHLLYVHRGLLRYYHLDAATGEERTGQFFDEGRVYADVASLVAGTPATVSVEALEPSAVLRIPRAALYAAYDADHAIERYGRLMLEEALVGAQRRAASLLTLGAEARYRAFVAARPEVARRVPQYLVASYLGITPEALSRIRGRAARRRGLTPPRAR